VGLGADQMIPIDGSLRLHEAITGSELTVLDRSGHMDWFTEVEALLGILHRFLEHT
jgi:pimeloyl-ACP methyl ester carboxylesterase